MDVTGLALMHLPDELLLVIFAFLDVCDLLSISRVSNHCQHRLLSNNGYTRHRLSSQSRKAIPTIPGSSAHN